MTSVPDYQRLQRILITVPTSENLVNIRNLIKHYRRKINCLKEGHPKIGGDKMHVLCYAGECLSLPDQERPARFREAIMRRLQNLKLLRNRVEGLRECLQRAQEPANFRRRMTQLLNEIEGARGRTGPDGLLW
jgi:hypothetical protein